MKRGEGAGGCAQVVQVVNGGEYRRKGIDWGAGEAGGYFLCHIQGYIGYIGGPSCC